MLARHWRQYTSLAILPLLHPSPYCDGILLLLSTRYGDNHGLYDNNALSKCEGAVGSGFGVFQRLSDLWFLHLLMSQPTAWHAEKARKEGPLFKTTTMPPIKEPAL